MATLTTQIKSYLYQQYVGDADLQAFFTAYNQLSQENLDAMNALNLPYYADKTGNLLNLVGEGIYGEIRHALATGVSYPIGMWNTYDYNQHDNNDYAINFTGNAYDVSDDQYKKILQWNTFKGDGYQFTIRWLKRRIYRFFFGDMFPNATYEISVTFSGNIVSINIPVTFVDAYTFQAAVESNTLLLPFQYEFNVNII